MRVGSSVSVLDFFHLGSSLSMRSFARLGSAVSVLDFGHIGSSVSLRSFARVGSSVSVLDFFTLGSSLSMRSFARLGSAVSVLDFSHVGSSVSLRSYARIGSSVSVLDFFTLGSSLSCRSFARIGSGLSLNDQIRFADTTGTYIYYNSPSPALEFYVKGQRSASMTGTAATTGGGTLHGIWYADQLLTVSDRRLKTNIRPLVDKLDSRAAEKGSTEAGARWLLRELRPVSFQFKSNMESKHHRFGFIADEIQMTMPELVREKHDELKTKAVLYEDMVAMFAVVLQSLQNQVEANDANTSLAKKQLTALEARLTRIEEVVARQADATEATVRRLEASIRRLLRTSDVQQV